MKNNFHWMCMRLSVVCLWTVVLSLFILTDGSLEAGNEAKEFDKSEPNIVVSSVTLPKVIGNNNAKLETVNFECEVSDKECEKDKLGFEAIRSLHLMIDDDHNGNVDLSESDEVHFASGSRFLTVHIVGTEDRNGGWHHAIRERHNFERRVAALEHRLSPFMETSHRNKVLTSRGDQ